MALKAEIGGSPLEIWFSPQFNIKTQDKRIESFLRTITLEVFNPWELRVKNVRATRSIEEAYLILEELRFRMPKLDIQIKQAPELPNSYDQGSDNEPVIH
ncbi:hypothetical protein [Virgibacillus halodenitrificans]|uniref:Uncharacterized protein n=1 Tax=Virgibacillus halodenitrificans TaxID=1482 RepID=A0ABR7VSD2_VIRHA|nr:hypothetical protein [Virgibacillus halodenitrificans]MBD1224803.1 hypothetical protein [Virgibacillus halodenitrificans]